MSIHISQHVKTSFFLFVLAILIFAPITYHFIYEKSFDETDFGLHIEWAISLAQKGPASIPAYVLAHAGWQIAIIFVHAVFPKSFQFAGFLVTLFSFGLTAVILFFWYQPVFSMMDWQSWKIYFVIIGVCIATPVSLLWPVDNLMYLGYIGISSYHNPTILLLKPFAILQFIFAYQCFRETSVVHNWQIILFALISSLCALIKPNLAICILPALIIFSIYRVLKREYLNYKALFWGLGLPSVIVLVWQFAVTYYANETGSIAFLPFTVMSAYSKYLGLKFLLSILFSLAVFITYFNEAIKDTRIILAWLIFLFGLVFTYFFAESGTRIGDGNFGWSGEIANVLLFMVSTLFCFEMFIKTAKSAGILVVLWSWHVVFGILYYIYCMFARSSQ